MGAAMRPSTTSKINLETVSLVWLDSSANTSQESIDAQQQLRLLNNHLETFESVDLCEQYIKSLPNADQIILIVSGRLGQEIVPRVYKNRHIVAIYVYCGDRTKNELWTKEFPKIRGLAVQLDELIRIIRSDQEKTQQNKINEPLIFTIFNSNVNKEQLISELNGQFVHSQLLIDCILHIKSTPADFNELLSICKEQYQGNKDELSLVRKFENEYSSQLAVRWYTRDSFVYRILNKALRAQNIHLLYLFRFLIRDLEKQLRDNQCSSHLTVYRGQLMSTDQLEIFKKSKGELISMNSFLSTSLNRKLAYSFLLEPNDLERVLFHIDANPRLPGIKPFANITKLSYYPEEEEVLFMLGSIFHLGEVTHDRNGIWTVKLTLCGDNDVDLKTLFNHMKSQDMHGELDLIKLGDVLQRMGKYDEAKMYYCRCLDALKSNDYHNMSTCYYALGRLADSMGDYELSLRRFEKSLEIDMKILHSDDPNIANTYNSIANIYQVTDQYKEALESYNKALKIFRQALGDSHPRVAMCLNNIGALYEKQRKYVEALNYYENALTIRQKHLLANDPDVGASHNNIGIVQRHLGDFDEALKQYNLALKIYKKALPPEHSDIAMTLENIGLAYEDMNNWQQALSYYKEASTIYHHALHSTHPHVIQIDQSIRRVSSKLK